MNKWISLKKYVLGLKAIICLNLIDAIFTLAWVEGGLAEEANPLMEYLLSESPALFMCYKIFLVHLCVWLLWRLRSRSFARVAIIPAITVYAMIVGYHIYSIFMI